MNKLLCCVLFLCLFFIPYGWAREEGLDKTGRQFITQTDINMLVDQVVNDLLSSGKLSGQPKIALYTVRNKTKDHIDGESILHQVGVNILKSEAATIVERAKLLEIAQEQALSQSLSKKSDAIKVGKIAGAKYLLHGTLSQNDNTEVIRSLILVINLNLVLTDLETSEDVWSSLAEVKKKVNKDFANWINKY